MKSEVVNVITASALEEALCLQYGDGFMEDIDNDISSFLFDTSYVNDSYKRYYFDELVEQNTASWSDEDHVRIENCIKAFLQDVFPGYDSVLIDVSW